MSNETVPFLRKKEGVFLKKMILIKHLMNSSMSTSSRVSRKNRFNDIKPPEPMSPVQGDWFVEIVAGRKTVEGRASAVGEYDSYIGTIIALRGNMNGVITNPIFVEVTDVRHYPDLDSYLAGEGWQRVAPHMSNNKATRKEYLAIKKSDGTQVFSPERIKERGGINAVEMKLISAHKLD
jgi:ASC-1-like (ASCH) protein